MAYATQATHLYDRAYASSTIASLQDETDGEPFPAHPRSQLVTENGEDGSTSAKGVHRPCFWLPNAGSKDFTKPL
ncbi:hypothetical protein PtrSN002B_011880, partial [Pyrenophora tritici-repentis]